MTDTLTEFEVTIDNALHAALDADVDARDLEMILQKRAQDMREVYAEQGEDPPE